MFASDPDARSASSAAAASCAGGGPPISGRAVVGRPYNWTVAIDIAQPEASHASLALADLSEDRLTAWAPDVAGDADLPWLANSATTPRTSDVTPLEVPTVGGGAMSVPVLHPSLLVALHVASGPIRARADELLGAGVIGYRHGANAGWHYAPAWRAFSNGIAELGSSHQWVAFTDVSSFFARTSWDHVLQIVADLAGIDARSELAPVADRFKAAGQTTLPSGYADARFLANLVLANADKQIGVPYLRWVDDYRLFADSEREARAALARLHDAMRRAGFEPNESKTRILPGAQAASEHRNALASVYHPERDSSETVRANLQRVLARAVQDPVARRRDLRFALSRMRREQDPAAVGWALQALQELPWEAPRLVSYLAAFDDRSVSASADEILAAAVQRADVWLIVRLIPLVWQIGTSDRSVPALISSLNQLEGTAAWGLALRLLANAGAEHVVRDAVHPGVNDARGAAAALQELGHELPEWLCMAEPALACAVREGPLPAPRVESLL
jgi:hypothetical protein